MSKSDMFDSCFTDRVRGDWHDAVPPQGRSPQVLTIPCCICLPVGVGDSCIQGTTACAHAQETDAGSRYRLAVARRETDGCRAYRLPHLVRDTVLIGPRAPLHGEGHGSRG